MNRTTHQSTRQAITCHHCGEQFSRPLPKQAVARWRTNCPYCGTECMLDLKPSDYEKSLFRDKTAK